MGTQAPVSFYDKHFQTDPDYAKHYSQSRYYGLWQMVVERLYKIEKPRILEFGCGPGLFAEMLQDRSFWDYVGIDFSPVAIAMAKTKSRQDFICADFFDAKPVSTPNAIFETVFDVGYNVVLALEVLEHLDHDLKLVERIRPGSRVIFTVPQFGAPSHVRVFKTEESVLDRYSPFLDEVVITKVKTHYFILEGRRKREA